MAEGLRVQNGEIHTPLGWHTRKWFTNDLPGWSLLTDGDADGEMAQDSVSPLNDRNPHSLRLTVKKTGRRCGAVNSGFWGMNFQAGEWYDLTLYARTEANEKLNLAVSLESRDGQTVCAHGTIQETGGGWKKYTLPLQASASDPQGRLVIALEKPGAVLLDTVSLFPRKTFKNRPNGMRPDLAQMLVNLRPGFLRFPGGCVVEGVTLQNRIRWKDSIGDISQRKGGFDLWGYYNTYGLGFHEYLQLAEDLGADAMYVVNCGMSCQARRPAEVAGEADLQFYVQECLDALEYAMGPASSEWGARRAANGHPEPFRIKYVEIGNENRGYGYQKHYRVFHDAIKAKYPQVIPIADTRMDKQPVEIVDDHFYVTPERFFGMANHYDNADRKGPKIYVGEYAVNRGVEQGSLLGALAEAVFMLNMEKNADVVQMASYAPLFENTNRRNWPVNLILFDSARVVGRSSYQLQKLFAAHRPDAVLPTTVRAPTVSLGKTNVLQLHALAGLDRKAGEVILKCVNPTPSPVSADVKLSGISKVGPRAKVFTLAHVRSSAENTLDNPDVVVPVESELPLPGPRFPCTFPPNSFTVLRIPASTP